MQSAPLTPEEREAVRASRQAKKLAKQQKNKTQPPATTPKDSKPAVTSPPTPKISTSKLPTPTSKDSAPKTPTPASKIATPKTPTQVPAPTPKAASPAAPKPAVKAAPVPDDSQAAASAGSEKSKAQLRAERRAQQEAQRQAKLTTRTQEQKPKSKEITAKPSKEKEPSAPREKPSTGKAGGEVERASWFRHLKPGTPPAQINSKEVAPSVVRLCAALRAGVVAGADARCVAFLHALQQAARDTVVGARVESARALEAVARGALAAVSRARPAPPAVSNAVAHLRTALAALSHDISERDAKSKLRETIDTYIKEEVETARRAISLAVRHKICQGDTVLTFGCSSLVEKVVTEAWAAGMQFSVLVVGSVTLVRRLAAAGLRTSYADITALSYVMTHVDKVLLGAAALLANGSVVGRAGTAQTALAAAARNVPVLVCCETHKFSERVQTDAFVCNELDATGGAGWAPLVYDVTPPELVTCVVTELAVLPCTSAPVVLRFKLNDQPF